MLEKCEQATQGYIPKATSSSPNGTANGNNESDSFTKDIQAFVQMLEKENRPLLTNNAELDGLVSVIDYKNHFHKLEIDLTIENTCLFNFQMIKALQVLRIHLLELEKVS